jgi:hypothetical protein
MNLTGVSTVMDFGHAPTFLNPKPARAKSGIQLRYSGTRDPSDEYQTSKKYEIAAKINFRIKKRY